MCNVQKENDQVQQPQISVKDHTQKFNRIASENALHLANQQPSPNKKKIEKVISNINYLAYYIL